MRQLAWLLSAMALTIILIPACTDPTEIGADLLDGDKAEIGFTDTLTLKATTVQSDSVLTYFPINTFTDALRTYPVGELADPIFGTSRAELFAQLTLTQFNPDFENVSIDSIVLALPMDSTNAYGNLSETYGLAVHRLTEEVNPLQNYFSNTTFQSDDMPLGTYAFTPSYDSLTIIDYSGNNPDTIQVPPQIRIPITAQIGNELIGLDSSFYRSDSAFLSYFKGLHIKPTTTNNGMLSLNLTSSQNAGLYVYYKRGTEQVNDQYVYQFNPFYARVINLENDATGSFVERYIGNEALGDSLVFVQGMTGVNTRLEIPYVDDFKDLVVNKAELEIRVAKVPGDDLDVYTLAPQLMLLYPEEDGDLQPIEDIQILRLQGESVLRQAYGGIPTGDNETEPAVYRMNLTAHFQSIIDGRNTNVLYISVFNRAQRATRVPLYGAKHPEYAIKLKIAFTRL